MFPMATDNPQTSRAVFPGLFLISAATLLLEVVWMRVLSVTLWYHFAFMVLSTALFGFGFAGVFLSIVARGQNDKSTNRSRQGDNILGEGHGYRGE